jgi:hypothetical protein
VACRENSLINKNHPTGKLQGVANSAKDVPPTRGHQDDRLSLTGEAEQDVRLNFV